MINKATDKVTWVTFTDGVKSALKLASFNQLCNDSGHEFKRLEIGYLIAEFCDRDAQNVMNSSVTRQKHGMPQILNGKRLIRGDIGHWFQPDISF